MKERIATKPVFDSLLRVTSDYCVNGGTKGAIVGETDDLDDLVHGPPVQVLVRNNRQRQLISLLVLLYCFE